MLSLSREDQRFAQLIEAQGLFEQERAGALGAPADLVVGERGHEDALDLPARLRQALDEPQATAQRHLDVGHDDVDGAHGGIVMEELREANEHLGAVASLEDDVTILGQRLDDEPSHLGIVFRNEDSGHVGCLWAGRKRRARYRE